MMMLNNIIFLLIQFSKEGTFVWKCSTLEFSRILILNITFCFDIFISKIKEPSKSICVLPIFFTFLCSRGLRNIDNWLLLVLIIGMEICYLLTCCRINEGFFLNLFANLLVRVVWISSANYLGNLGLSTKWKVAFDLALIISSSYIVYKCLNWVIIYYL